ncbi:MAG TPA: DUF5719 family protein [Microlunatus sp.]|nr:DUF5719 family protein [Microlunatus sp.]
MSGLFQSRTSGVRGAGVLGVVAGVAVLLGGGSLLRPAVADPPPPHDPVIGRTNVVCPVAPSGGEARSVIQAVSNHVDNERPGTLTATPAGGDKAAFQVKEPGKGVTRSAPKATMIVTGQGGMATSNNAATLTSGAAGVNAGLLGATCTKPGPSHLFVGVGARRELRTELVVTNPDATPAQVDVRFLGAQGPIDPAGGSGIEIAGGQSRVIALDSMITSDDPLSVEVVAARGRVAAIARDYRSKGDKPRGADWHPASTAAATEQIIPGVPDGSGARQLAVVNPGQNPAQVSIVALGLQGEFVPAGADKVEVPAQSTAVVKLGPGLVEQAAAIQLSSDQPVSGAVLADAPSRDASGDKVVPDFAVQVTAPQLRRLGVLPFIGETGLEGQLLLSHVGSEPVEVTVQVVSLAGVEVRSEKIKVAASSTVSRSVTSPLPSYLVIRAPENSGVYAGLVQRRTESADVAGITTFAVSSPDVGDRVRPASSDPWTAR